MLTRITAAPKNYDWGSHTAIPHLLGYHPTEEPQAELWLGAHPDSTTVITTPARGQAPTLNQWINNDPASALGEGRHRLPFLLKILAADKPLSLQAHPTREQAREGFADENKRRIPRDHPTRNYKDEWHKPELIVALEDGFQALCGFRPIEQTTAFLTELALRSSGTNSHLITGLRARVLVSGLEATVGKVLLGQPIDLVNALVEASNASGEPWDEEKRLLIFLDQHYPDDPGIAIAALMNFVTLARGEALYLPAGNIHAYVRGLGVEIMAASDNVLRGGLTSKNIDVPELLKVLDFSSISEPRVEPASTLDGYSEYPVPVPDFRLLRVEASGEANLGSPEALIVLAANGNTTISTAKETVELRQGEAVFAPPSSEKLHIRTEGTAYIATSATF